MFVRRDTYGRYVSCLVYLAERSLHHAGLQQDGAASSSRRWMRRASTTPPGSASQCWPGCTSSSRADPAPSPDFDSTSSNISWPRPPDLGRDDFAAARDRPVGRGDGATRLLALRQRVPEAYREDFPPRRGWRDVRRMENLVGATVACRSTSPSMRRQEGLDSSSSAPVRRESVGRAADPVRDGCRGRRRAPVRDRACVG